MKKMLNHSVFLQILCTILVIVSLNNFLTLKEHEKLLSEVLIVNLNDMTQALENINIELINIYMNGIVGETVGINTDSFYNMDRISNEVETLLGIDNGAMRWYRLGSVESAIRKMKRKDSLSEKDSEYILNAHNINQQLLNAYEDILNAYGDDKYLSSGSRKHVIDIYKSLSTKGDHIINSDLFIELYDFEVLLSEDLPKETGRNISKGEAEKIAKELYYNITGTVADFRIQETSDLYEFKEDWNINSDKDNYEVTIYKDNLEVAVHLSAWSGDGQFSEAKIDESAKKYIAQFIPEGYVIFDKDIRLDDKKIDSITYTLVDFDDKYYNGQNEIRLKVDNQGKLKSFNYFLMESSKTIGAIVDEETIANQINLGTIESIILVLNHEDEFEYRVKLNLNNATYILSFDALTGEQRTIFNSDRFYGNHLDL